LKQFVRNFLQNVLLPKDILIILLSVKMNGKQTAIFIQQYAVDQQICDFEFQP